ncbi:MAG: IgGFc-binding protein [Myxococcota bacterium]|nr:IgGFc-binding protein [Myxococcota bacterium]
MRPSLRAPLHLLLALAAVLHFSSCYQEPIGEGGPGDDDDTASDDDDTTSDDDDTASDDDDTTSDDDDTTSDDDDTASDDDDSVPECEPEGATTCWGNEFMECVSTAWSLVDLCVDPTPLCDNALGCLACSPGVRSCDGNNVVECLLDGSGTSLIEECDPNETCMSGQCVSACTLAEQQMGYLGCEFIAVTTSNIVVSAFDNDFAVVVGNPAGGPAAQVTVTRGGSVVATATVASGGIEAIELPMVTELKDAQDSVLVVDGAYEILSDVPVAAYQYNPLHFEVGGTFSHTNDASLLLPKHALTGNYMVSTWPTWGYGQWVDTILGGMGEWAAWHPGFVSIAATEDGTSVTFDSSTSPQAGVPGAMTPGQTVTLSLDRGDVVQIFSQRPGTGGDWNYCSSQGWTSTQSNCPPTWLNNCESYCSVDDGDLTGSLVTASAPVAVFAGHMCTFMPYNEWACDHLEEMMFPVETWGTNSVMSAPAHPSGSGVAPAWYRVMVLNNATTLNFDPAVHGSVVLDAGEFVQFETDQDFVVTGTDDFYVTQTLLSEDALNQSGGDPAMGSGIPWNQVRNTYDFLTPASYTTNYVNIVIPAGTSIELDGSPVTGFSAIATTGYEAARVPLAAGAHHVESTNGLGFGITSYGYADYTSYLYPGGMDFSR